MIGKMFGWSKLFEEGKVYDDIPNRVRKTEIYYWVFIIPSILLIIAGWVVMMSAPPSDVRSMLVGLFLAIVGIVNVAVMKIWAHVRLCLYMMIWDRQNRLQRELDQMAAADL